MDFTLYYFIFNTLMTLMNVFFFVRTRDARKLSVDLQNVKLDQGDLFERFNKFQAREGMRAAREVKEQARQTQQDALQLLAEHRPVPDPPSSTKAALRRKLRGLQ